MEQNNKFRQTILVVDDLELNREIIKEILSDKYNILEAENGREAVEILEESALSISLILLDVVMPEMDGFGVLLEMNKRGWVESIPVIMISAESASDFVDRAYSMGVTDFISRPFDLNIVQHRVDNTLTLYAKQQGLKVMITKEILKREKSNNLMVSILSHIVESRNGESGLHTLHIRVITEMLLRNLAQRSDKSLSKEEISRIGLASTLHDIGKIAIPETILNKPGRLTPDEYAIMKEHTTKGAEILHDLMTEYDDPLLYMAHDICRWHHERYDGRGYPDGLVGDQIPISAQVVSVADVYDALTGERCYKKAFSHEKAMQMIMDGECGIFNPMLLECLKDVSGDLQKELLS